MAKTVSSKQNIKKKRFLRALRLLGVIVLLIFIAKLIYVDLIRPGFGKYEMISTEAIMDHNGEISTIDLSLHNSLDGVKMGDKIKVTFTLPALTEYSTPILEFKGFYCNIDYVIEDENGKTDTISEKREEGFNGLIQGFRMYRLPLDRTQKGRITVEFEAGDDDAIIFVPDFYIRDGLGGIRSFVSVNITKIMISVFMLILGIAIIVFGLFNKNLNVENRRLIWLGCTYVFISTWVILISGMMQLVTENFRYYYYIEYLSLAMTFVCISMYMVESTDMKFLRVYSMINSITMLILMMILICLDVFGVVSLHKMLTLIRVVMLLIFSEIIIYCIREKRQKHNNINYIIFGMVFMIAVFIVEVIYNRGSLARYEFTQGYLPFAICVFMAMFMLDNISGLSKYYMNRGEKQILERLAYEDPLTRLPNRRACELRLSQIESDEDGCYLLMMLDVNGLKYVNDNFGHKAGDELLKEMSRVAKNAVYLCEGMVGRFGGDEFVAVVPVDASSYENEADKGKNEFERISQALKKECAKINKDSRRKYDLRFSYGYSIYESGSGESAWQTLKKADNGMYSMKKEGHEDET